MNCDLPFPTPGLGAAGRGAVAARVAVRWWGGLASLALVGCATAPPPVLSAADWRVEPPAAACVARIQQTNKGDEWRRYDAEGRLLFGITTGASDQRAAEWLTWRGDKLVAVDSYVEGAGNIWGCRGVGLPVRAEERTIGRSELRWKGAQLVEITISRRIYRLDDDCAGWHLHHRDDDDFTYEYRGRWLKAEGRNVRYEFEGDRPVRRRTRPRTHLLE